MRLLDCPVMRVALAVVLIATVVGCKKKSSEGLPPATDWQTGNAEVAQLQRPQTAPSGAPGDDPHAGLGIPPANQDEGDEGDEGSQAMPDDDAHAAAGHATTSADPTKRIRGVLKVSPKLRDRVKPGSIVFLFVKAVGADNQPTGTPLAVDRMDFTADGAAFELGSSATGDVFVMARVDQDGDAMKPQPGDITAQVRAKVPADKVELVLDTVVP